jgi:predicted ATPase
VHRSTLAANLGSREVLLVLDNCEHLLDASAALADAVLDAGPEARILVTSREPLRVDGEVDHRIGSLGASSAELFVERAEAAAGPGAASTDDARIVDLCARLDGLPLAIELAAAQLRHLSLTELVERLDDRLTLLVGGRPKAGERHIALATAIDWSYQLLSDQSRDLFDRLGVFPASFDLEAVQAVADDPDPATATILLGDLVAKSLVVHDARTGRYRLLETIRLFASDRLHEAGLRADVTERLRRHLVARVAVIPRVRTWLSAAVAAHSRDDLENVRLAFDASLDRGDVVSAVDLALGLSTLWRNAVSYAEGLRWVAALRERELPPAEGLWTAILAADVGLGSGDPFMMREAAAEAAAFAEQFDEPGAAVVTEIYTAISRFVQPSEAAKRLERARDRAHEIGEPGLERLARAFRLVALLLLGRGDGLDAEARGLIDADSGGGYDHYICIFAASLVALVDRDAARQRELMRIQIADLTRSGLRENWLTMYWESLARIAEGGDYLAQLRSARRRAEAEGRSAEADCVLALSYAAACDENWEGAAELLGVIGGGLLRDTASFIHFTLLREQLVRPKLESSRFEQATARGQELDVKAILEAHGL